MESSTNIKEGVLNAIRTRKVTMRPAALFKVEFFLIALVCVVVLFLTIGLAGFILFGLRINGHESLLSFGPSAIGVFLQIFPWPLFLLDVVFLFILQSLIRRFAFGYRKPIFVVLVLLFVVGGASAFLLDRGTPFHDRLMEESHQGNLPAPVGNLYGSARGPAPHEQGIFRGIVKSIQSDRIVIQHDDLDLDQDEKGFEVILPKGKPQTSFFVGENVYVYGRENKGVITAVGITELSSVK